MNFVFVSPQFPKTYWNFCDRLKHNGVNVLGIGDSGYDEIPDELKECLTEYYRVDSMADYDAMVRAMGYFTFKYGKIDWLESNNEFWLEQDAALRTFFFTCIAPSTSISSMMSRPALFAFSTSRLRVP